MHLEIGEYIVTWPHGSDSLMEFFNHNNLLLTIKFTVEVETCETWSLTLREEHRLKVFENRVLRRMFGPKRDEVTGG
jgi:hypothetical protein